jgi:hypothetical protein
VIENMRNQHALAHVIDQSDDPIFVTADIEDCRGLFGSRILCDIGLPKQAAGFLKIQPTRLPCELKPLLKRASMPPALGAGGIKRLKLSSADHIHHFTLCEDHRFSSSIIREISFGIVPDGKVTVRML